MGERFEPRILESFDLMIQEQDRLSPCNNQQATRAKIFTKNHSTHRTKNRVRLNRRRLWRTEPMRGELLLPEKQTRAGPSRRWSAYTKKTAELSRSLETQPDWALPLQENTGAESKSRTSEGLLTQNGKLSQTERPTRGSEQKNASRNSRLRAFLWRGDRPYR
jgi:hypothetical protein